MTPASSISDDSSAARKTWGFIRYWTRDIPCILFFQLNRVEHDLRQLVVRVGKEVHAQRRQRTTQSQIKRDGADESVFISAWVICTSSVDVGSIRGVSDHRRRRVVFEWRRLSVLDA